LAALSLVMVAGAAGAQSFPTKTVHLVVPFPPGGATDALARLMADKLAERWKQPVLVENKPGANTTLGTDVVAKSAPDGHTLGLVTGSHVINPLLTSKLPYDTLKDLTGVMLLTRFHMALYANPSFPANNPAELMALAKKEPGRVSYGSATTQSYLGMELLNSMAGTTMQYVPYKGSSQALTDVLGGHIPLMIDPVLQSTVDHAKQGRLKIIAIMGAQPSELTPGVPLMASAVPGYEFSGAFGLVARGGTAPELVRRIRDDFAAVLKLPDVAERVKAIGQESVGSTPEEYNAYIQAEMKKWEPVVKSTGAKLD
ncbi:MAG TPA: tripartite tricarboxylate transporter substrate binding protein, partial [Ramlibacter sp.]|nr:tripartite tricarboxylate transporter substrate binding protein [Ramlibacter sp.]